MWLGGDLGARPIRAMKIAGADEADEALATVLSPLFLTPRVSWADQKSSGKVHQFLSSSDRRDKYIKDEKSDTAV